MHDSGFDFVFYILDNSGNITCVGAYLATSNAVFLNEHIMDTSIRNAIEWVSDCKHALIYGMGGYAVDMDTGEINVESCRKFWTVDRNLKCGANLPHIVSN